MAEQVLTLCEKCAQLMQSGGFNVQQISGGSIRITLRGRKCENCEQSFGAVRRYSVARRS